MISTTNAQVEGIVETRTVITITIEEHDQYRIGDVRVIGNKQLATDEIRNVLNLVLGEIYDETALRNNFQTLKKMYSARGFANFTATPVQDLDDMRKLINLTFNIQEAPY